MLHHRWKMRTALSFILLNTGRSSLSIQALNLHCLYLTCFEGLAYFMNSKCCSNFSTLIYIRALWKSACNDKVEKGNPSQFTFTGYIFVLIPSFCFPRQYFLAVLRRINTTNAKREYCTTEGILYYSNLGRYPFNLTKLERWGFILTSAKHKMKFFTEQRL